MNLTVDLELNSAIFLLPEKSCHSMAYLLSRASIKHKDYPLEEHVCRNFGLVPKPDFPIGAIASNVDGFNVSDDFVMRADPVNFVMQRDAYTLSEQLPIKLDINESNTLISTLNDHFVGHGFHFHLGESGAWYVFVGEEVVNKYLPVETALPSLAVHKNVYQFMPQGLHSTFWISFINEIQMVLFDHPINKLREAKGELAVNSVWLSGGGELPEVNIAADPNHSVVVAKNPLYEGLAKLDNCNYAKLSGSAVDAFSKLIESADQDVRLRLCINNDLEAWFSNIQTLIRTKKVKHLTLNLGWYEQTISANISYYALKKFWRKLKPLQHYLEV